MLDGEEIKPQGNGYDGVLFVSDNNAPEPFEYNKEFASGIYPRECLDRYIFDKINFASGAEVVLKPPEQKCLFEIWLYSLFFESILPTKPILLFLGEKGSGKT